MTTGIASLDVQVAWADDPLQFTLSGSGAHVWSSLKTAGGVQRIHTRRGWQPNQPFADTGDISVEIDDRTGLYNPANASGANFGKLTSYRQIRYLGTDSGSAVSTIFRGHVVPRGWPRQPLLPGTSVVSIKGADLFQMLARFEQDPIDPTDTPIAEFPAALQFAGILTNAGLPSAWYQVMLPGASMYGAVLGESFLGDNLLGHLQTMQLSDGGFVFISQDGKVTFEQRLNIWLDPTRSTVQATFADDGTGGSIPYEYDSLSLDYGADIITQARYTGVSGNTRQITHSSASTLTGLPNTDEKTLYTRDDEEVLSRAALAVALRSAESFGPASITYNAGESTTAFDAFLHLDLNHRVRLKTSLPGESTRTSEHFISSIDSDWDASDPNALKVTLGLVSAAPWDALGSATSWLILDDATLGKLNTGKLAY